MKRWITLLIVAGLALACLSGCAEEGDRKAQTAATTEKADAPYGVYVCKLGLDCDCLEAGVLREYIKNFGEIDYVLQLNENLTLEMYLDLDLDNYIVAFLKKYANREEMSYAESRDYWISKCGSEESFRSLVKEEMNGHLGTKAIEGQSVRYSVSGNTIRCEWNGEVFSFTYDGNSVRIPMDDTILTFVRK